MATKTINIMDDVYDLLTALKRPGESFSDQIRRLTTEKNGIMDLAGAWKNMSDEEAKMIKERVNERRRYMRER